MSGMSFNPDREGFADLALDFERSTGMVSEGADNNTNRYLSIAVAKEALAIYVKTDNPLKGLTLFQVDALFSSTRKCGYPFYRSSTFHVDFNICPMGAAMR